MRICFWFTAVVPIAVCAPMKSYNGPERLTGQATSTSGSRNEQERREISPAGTMLKKKERKKKTL